jgi:hypothetical protein
MADITNPKLLWIKAVLFVAIGVLASVLLLLDLRELRDAVLFVLAIWAFCRAYYFAFYVVEHYIDSGFKFSGLTSVLLYLLKRGSQTENVEAKKRLQHIRRRPDSE